MMESNCSRNSLFRFLFLSLFWHTEIAVAIYKRRPDKIKKRNDMLLLPSPQPPLQILQCRFFFWKKSINNLNSRRLLLRCVKSIEIDLFFSILWSFWSSLVVIEYADLIVNTNASNTHSANIHTIDVQSFFNLRHSNIQINNEFKNVIGIMTIVATVLSWMLIHCKWNKLKYLLK